MTDKVLELDPLVDALLTRVLYPGEWVAQMAPWERLMREPRWHHAKPLVEAHLERVSRVVEQLVPTREFATSHGAWVCLGKVRACQKNWAGAEQALRRALEHHSPENVKAWYNLALVLQAQGRTQEAKEAVRRALVERRTDERALALLDTLETDSCPDLSPCDEAPRLTP